jgi:hypothetical protein
LAPSSSATAVGALRADSAGAVARSIIAATWPQTTEPPLQAPHLARVPFIRGESKVGIEQPNSPATNAAIMTPSKPPDRCIEVGISRLRLLHTSGLAVTNRVRTD